MPEPDDPKAEDEIKTWPLWEWSQPDSSYGLIAFPADPDYLKKALGESDVDPKNKKDDAG